MLRKIRENSLSGARKRHCRNGITELETGADRHLNLALHSLNAREGTMLAGVCASDA